MVQKWEARLSLNQCLFEQPELGEHFPPAQALAGVHLQQPDRCASRGGLTYNAGTLAEEMILPAVLAGMEQARHRTGVGINTSEVGTLLEITLRTGEGEIGVIIGATVLTGDDMFEVKTQGGGRLGGGGSIRSGGRPAGAQGRWWPGPFRSV